MDVNANHHRRKPSLRVHALGGNAALRVGQEDSKMSVVPQFKDVDPESGRAYRCVDLDTELFRKFETYEDFSNVTETIDAILRRSTGPQSVFGFRERSYGPQLFLVTWPSPHPEHGLVEDGGTIMMVHVQTQRICRGLYTTPIILDAPGKGCKQGVIIFDDFTVTRRYPIM